MNDISANIVESAAEPLHAEGGLSVVQQNELKSFHGIIARSNAMHDVFDLVRKVSDSDSTIVIYGESGTGKELIAKAIHKESDRRDKPFIAINCGAIPENLLESELFGHMRGAFTSANTTKEGKFEQACGGTIFLDEIGDMSFDLQVKILRVLEEREFYKVGGSKPVSVNVRVIAATHRNLDEMVKRGEFREDLFYRLHVIPIMLPSLRERLTDIPVLFEFFCKKFNDEKKRNVCGISPQALHFLKQYDWPGNIREFKNLVERLIVLKGVGEIGVSDLPDMFKPQDSLEVSEQNSNIAIPTLSEEGLDFNIAVSEFEKSLICQSLEKSQGVKNKAAKLLHLNRTTLVEKIKRYRLEASFAAP